MPHARSAATATLALAALIAAPVLAQTTITEDFESFPPGDFPAPDWLDVAEAPTVPNAPIPSCIIDSTTGPDGQPTQVLANVDAMAGSQGIYRFIPVSSRYIVRADVRVDQLHDFAEGEATDWTFEIGVGQFIEGADFCCTPQIGVYGSCFTGGWRLYVAGANGAFADIDLALPIDLGRWYTVELDLDATRGVARTRIDDASTGQRLADQTHILDGWTPADGRFDLLNIFESDFPSEDSTQANLCVLDNIEATLIGGPCSGDFDGDGEVNTLDVLAFLNAWAAGCP